MAKKEKIRIHAGEIIREMLKVGNAKIILREMTCCVAVSYFHSSPQYD